MAEAPAPTSSTSTWAVRPSEVTGGLCGSALMRDLDQAERLIDAAVERHDAARSR